MRNWTKFFLGATLIASLAACASDGAPDRDGGDRVGPDGPRSGGRAPRYPNTFISPAGKPYHAPFGAPYPVAAWFADADANHDGRLTREEFRADAQAFFQTLDMNHDGVIDGAEVENYEQSVAPEILPHIGRLTAEEGMDTNLDLGDPHNTERPTSNHQHRMGQSRPTRPTNKEPSQGEGAALFSLLNQPEPITAADADFDGRVTLAEFTAAADRRFDRLDTKEQDFLVLSELPKTPVQEAIEKAAFKRAKEKRASKSSRDHQDGSEAPPQN